ncbi:MAG: hypothetical protein FJ292_08995 [Planctomycetes bacterium]|nr:hypothetical protein [Planctomycetota bacterium]
MRHAAGWVLDSLLAIIGGLLLTTLLAAGLVQACIGLRIEQIDVWMCDRNVPWWISRHAAIGVRWINGNQNLTPLLGETPLQPADTTEPLADGPPPAEWALSKLPPLAGLPIDSRFAALGVGWPVPAFVRTWVVLDPQESFPISAELDQSGFAIESAIARLGSEDLSRVRIDIRGLALDASLWIVASLGALRWLRVRRLNRPAAAAAPPAPAA